MNWWNECKIIYLYNNNQCIILIFNLLNNFKFMKTCRVHDLQYYVKNIKCQLDQTILVNLNCILQLKTRKIGWNYKQYQLLGR